MTATDRAERTSRLIAARRRDSTVKQDRALAAVTDLLTTGQRVTISEVARRAGVSTWFIYNTAAVRTTVDQAVTQQAAGPRPPRPAASAPGAEGLRTELSLAREEIRALRAERDTLTKKVALLLGGQLEQIPHERLVARIHELESTAADLRSQADAELQRADKATDRATALDEELTAARAVLKRMIQTASPARRTGEDNERG
ncbi:DUF6262 family protein [Nocardia tengchongensis]|uniref:DUF6262 family protein n=1 Tax=Nocardia tengchongensis TaxID=2055889 RepID=UPI0036748190